VLQGRIARAAGWVAVQPPSPRGAKASQAARILSHPKQRLGWGREGGLLSTTSHLSPSASPVLLSTVANRWRIATGDAAYRPRSLFERRGWTPLAATFEKAPLRVGGRMPISAPDPAVPDGAAPISLGSGVRGGAGHAVSPRGQSPLSTGRRGSPESRGARPLQSRRTNRPHEHAVCVHPGQVLVCAPGVTCAVKYAGDPCTLMLARIGRPCDGTPGRGRGSLTPPTAGQSPIGHRITRASEPSQAARILSHPKQRLGWGREGGFLDANTLEHPKRQSKSTNKSLANGCFAVPAKQPGTHPTSQSFPAARGGTQHTQHTVAVPAVAVPAKQPTGLWNSRPPRSGLGRYGVRGCVASSHSVNPQDARVRRSSPIMRRKAADEDSNTTNPHRSVPDGRP
jgi:hypothetical protein